MFETTDQITIIRIVYDTQIIILYDSILYNYSTLWLFNIAMENHHF